MKLALFILLPAISACSSTATIADLKPISQKMSCSEIVEQVAIADDIIMSSSSENYDTNVARSGVNVATQAASVGGAGAYASLGNSLFGLGSALYKQSGSSKTIMLEEAREKKTQLEDLYYDKGC